MTAVVPQFQFTRCTRYRYRYSTCQRCADACPHQAIVLNDEGAAVDRGRCRNCGLCASACHTAAFVPGNFPRIDLLKRAIKQERFRFACAPSGIEADAIVPCLGAIDAPTLAYLAWRGVDAELHGSGHCAKCVHGEKGAAQLAANIEAAATLKPAEPARRWAPPQLCTGDSESDSAKHGFRSDRRQMFRRLTARGLDRALRPAADQPVPEKAIRPGSWFVPESRELLQIVCKTGGTAYAGAPHEVLPLMDIEIGAGCTACEVCARACPTGAIQVRENEEQWVLQFEFDHCVACGVCLEVCQPDVLRPRSAFDAAAGRAPMAMHRLAKQRCNRCDRFFVSPVAQETCVVCRDDEDAFAAIFG